MGAPETIPFHLSDLGPEEIEAATACLSGGEIGGDGPIGRQVEQALCRYTGSRYALLVTSATHALELALAALEVGPGDEVICPSFTFPSTANCVLAMAIVIGAVFLQKYSAYHAIEFVLLAVWLGGLDERHPGFVLRPSVVREHGSLPDRDDFGSFGQLLQGVHQILLMGR